jgi:putative N6-adenine-specific DNA methylase
MGDGERRQGTGGAVIVRRGQQRAARELLADLTLFATTAKGLEELLAAELTALGAARVHQLPGGVQFCGDQALVGRANLWLRTANRVLLRLAAFPCTTPDDLYRGVQQVSWADWLTPDMTLAVSCTLKDSQITHSGYAALKAKDAIVDAMRAHYGARSSVNPRDPDLPVQLYINRNHCTLYLDTSGVPLDHRGYRLERGEAPLREHLAAALVLLSGWQGEVPLYDPFCGAGTILAEAAMIATNRAPGLLRDSFAFQRWPMHSVPLWRDERAAAEAAQRPLSTAIMGSDQSAAVLKHARANLERAGITSGVGCSVRSFSDFTPDQGPGVIICNPPYGERMGDEAALVQLYRQLGDVLKQRCGGSRAFVLTRQGMLAKEVGLRPTRRYVLWNGPIECRLLHFDLYSGQRGENP